MSADTPLIQLPDGNVIGCDAPVFIVAEIGLNHDGDPAKAEALIHAAAEAGADAVKFQIVDPDYNYAPDHPSYAIFRKLGLPNSAYPHLADVSHSQGLAFFATPDTPSLNLVPALQMPLIKISSGMLTDLPHLEKACKLGIPLMLSTGMSYLDEVIQTLRFCRHHGAKDLIVLHCTSLYPAPPETLNLRAIELLAAATDAVVGFSDHSAGPLAAALAVAHGAKVIEKHLTLDCSGEGAEHHFSADQQTFTAMVQNIRDAEQMLGDGRKEPHASEEPNRTAFRRCVVARHDIAAGELLSRDNAAVLRPSPGTYGLEPFLYAQVLGLRTAQAIPRGHGITLAMLANQPVVGDTAAVA